MSKVLSALYNVGATLVQRCTFNANGLPTLLTIFQRWANVIMLSGVYLFLVLLIFKVGPNNLSGHVYLFLIVLVIFKIGRNNLSGQVYIFHVVMTCYTSSCQHKTTRPCKHYRNIRGVHRLFRPLNAIFHFTKLTNDFRIHYNPAFPRKGPWQTVLTKTRSRKARSLTRVYTIY